MKLKELKKEIDVQMKKMKRPLPGHIIPKHHITVHKLKGGKIAVHIPKSWREEWKTWAGPTKVVWGRHGIEQKRLKDWGKVIDRREFLEKAGMIAGFTLPLATTVGISARGPDVARAQIPVIVYLGAFGGEWAGDKLENYLERHEEGYKKLKHLLQKEEKRVSRKLASGIKSMSPVMVT